jgi:hypothetical protein
MAYILKVSVWWIKGIFIIVVYRPQLGSMNSINIIFYTVARVICFAFNPHVGVKKLFFDCEITPWFISALDVDPSLAIVNW